jgi:hypothetical protein
MRFFFGMIVGAALMLGFAYVHDMSANDPMPPTTDAATQRPYVNWEVVGASARAAAVTIREQWDKLTSK